VVLPRVASVWRFIAGVVLSRLRPTFVKARIMPPVEKKQLLGIIGSTVLFVGVFTPLVSLPIVGNMNYFQNGQGDGAFVLILAVISLVLALTKRYRWLWATGLLSLALMAYTFVTVQTRLSEAQAKMKSELEGNPFAGIADVAMQSVQLQWGWAVLVVGAALIIAAAAVREEPHTSLEQAT